MSEFTYILRIGNTTKLVCFGKISKQTQETLIYSDNTIKRDDNFSYSNEHLFQIVLANSFHAFADVHIFKIMTF